VAGSGQIATIFENSLNASLCKILAMLSDLILEHKGKAASNRILNADIQKQETTVTARGKVKGSLDVSIIITYWNLPRSDKSGNHHNDSTTLQCYYGEGRGIISIPSNGYGIETVTVTEYVIGKLIGQKTIWRGSAFYRTSSSSRSRESFLSLIML
jgi:hypothetical protein